MIYLQDKRYWKPEQPRSLSWLFFLLVVVIFVLYYWGIFLFWPINWLADKIGLSFIRSSQSLAQTFSPSELSKSKTTLLLELRKAKQAEQELSQLALRVRDLEEENNSLRGLRLATSSLNDLVLAHIIAKPPKTPYDVVVVDVGSEKDRKMQIGDLVFLDQRLAVGEVVEIAAHYSKVRLYSTGGTKLPVLVGPKDYPAVAAGQGLGNFSLLLPRGVTIQTGDLVYTTLIGRNILGTVGSIVKNENDPYQKIYVKSPYSLMDLSWLYISHEQTTL